MELFAIAGAAQRAAALAAEAPAAGLQINFFWVIVSSLNFIVFAIAVPSGSPFGGMLTGEYRANVDWMTDRGLRAGLVFDPLDALASALASQSAFTPPTGPGGTVTTTTTTPPGGMPHL